MRGSPLLRAVLTLLALLLMAWPVWRVTRASAPTAAPEPDATADTTPAKVRLRLSFLPGPPLEWSVRHLGRVVWSGASGGGEAESPELAIPIPEEGVDLQVTARWPAGTAIGAARLRLVRSNSPALERSAWTDERGALDAVLTFQD